MASNDRKTHLAVALDNASRSRAGDAIQILGKALPCRITKIEGQIVTVAFEINSPFTLPEVRMPIHTSVYDWIPLAVGDKGVAVPTDAYLGGISGLGGGTADLSTRANLATHKFHPVTNTAWMPPGGGDQDDRILQSLKKGVLLKGKSSKKVYLDESGVLIVDGDIHCKGAIIAGYGTGDQVGVQTHTHAQDNDSNSDTEQETNKPTAGT